MNGFLLFCTFLLYHIIFSRFFPVDENNVLQAPWWYYVLGILLSGFVSGAFTDWRKEHGGNTSLSDQDPPPDLLDCPEQALPYQDPLCNWPESELNRIDNMDGLAFENWCADALQAIDFTDINLTPRSGDQGVDILAQKDGIKYAIQCKCYSSNLGNTPIQEVTAGKSYYRCHVGVVITNRYFTPGAVELADATGTLLWDRDWITEHLDRMKPAIPPSDQLRIPGL